MVIGRLSLAAGLMVLLPVAAQAQHRGSMEDQLACTPDVYRLCAAQIPDEDAIVACLKSHLDALSAPCHRVFAGPATPQPGNPSVDEDE